MIVRAIEPSQLERMGVVRRPDLDL